ncbi:hypothetical protein [Mucilaginibacter jinjuensis]|uniref:SdpI/YhfL family protein n=1 Tax=Mucilaginibacter jinjuensis TaxID=1176721 RepID=A0ABY7TDE1_9SPHI|nr:hypothetical protein [Mucilaginibacter jinjuensis]WCT14351.1 hypothetical protein PQO05_10445 [Mucilaginibacter jinjuensis]
MEKNLTLVILFVSTFGSISYIIGAVLNYRLKSKFLNRGLSDVSLIKAIDNIRIDSRLNALKWALILSFLGIGLIINKSFALDPNSITPYIILSFSIALGLLLFYLIKSKPAKEKQ